MKIKSILALAAASLAAFLMCAQPAAAQFVGQPMWRSDPTGTCSYPGRLACPEIYQQQSAVPIGATQVTGASGVVSAATAAASLAAVAAKTNYLTGFSITGGGATSASLITCTLSGLITGSETYVFAVASGATAGSVALTRSFNHPIPASAVNTAITMSCPTFGSGNTAAAVNVEGYVQ